MTLQDYSVDKVFETLKTLTFGENKALSVLIEESERLGTNSFILDKAKFAKSLNTFSYSDRLRSLHSKGFIRLRKENNSAKHRVTLHI